MRIVIFAVAISVWIHGGPLWGQAKNQDNQVRKPANTKAATRQDEQRGTKDAPIFIHIEESPDKQTAATQTKKSNSASSSYDKLSSWSTFWTAVFTGLLFLVGGAGVCAALKTLAVLKQQTNALIAQFDQWVEFGDWKIGRPQNGKVWIGVDLSNPSDFPLTLHRSSITIHTPGDAKDFVKREFPNTFMSAKTPTVVEFVVPITEGEVNAGSARYSVTASFNHFHRITKKTIPQRFFGRIECWSHKPEQMGVRSWYIRFYPTESDTAEMREQQDPN